MLARSLAQEVAELVLAVMLQQGHKTPTHMAKILVGCFRTCCRAFCLRSPPQQADDSPSFGILVPGYIFFLCI